MELLEVALTTVVECAILLFEWTGVLVLLASGILGIVRVLRRDPEIRLKLAKGLAMGLEFTLGGEILRIVTVRELTEVAVVGAIIVIHVALTVLIHWEIKNEEADEKRSGE